MVKTSKILWFISSLFLTTLGIIGFITEDDVRGIVAYAVMFGFGFLILVDSFYRLFYKDKLNEKESKE